MRDVFEGGVRIYFITDILSQYNTDIQKPKSKRIEIREKEITFELS